MRNRNLLSVIMIAFIIVGGIIFFIGKKPHPEPQCIVCGDNILSILGFVEVILGAIALSIHIKEYKTGNISH
ncbi:hypothetical protein [Flavobacterium sp.]|uniref:hypothetical protein n=1 Tax=Flavobacterium sp. TaxID=239 RepID=UPI0026073298|nr:hypothetical protein [Flavobacterium sp.]